MGARAISSGTISFGMVVIPVKVFPSVKTTNAIKFNRLHESCHGRLKQQNYCSSCDTTVSSGEMVKGYEFAKGQYVVFEPQELRALEAQSTGEISIETFLPLKKVDPIYFDKGYYLGYDKGAQKPYSLLHAALRQSKLAALAKYKTRGKEHLVLIRPTKKGLVLQHLFHAEDVREFSALECDLCEISDEELSMATQIIERNVQKKFSPKKYKDELRAKLQEQIQHKIEGKEITMPQDATPRAEVVDLMSMLKASLEQPSNTADQKNPEKKSASK